MLHESPSDYWEHSRSLGKPFLRGSESESHMRQYFISFYVCFRSCISKTRFSFREQRVSRDAMAVLYRPLHLLRFPLRPEERLSGCGRRSGLHNRRRRRELPRVALPLLGRGPLPPRGHEVRWAMAVFGRRGRGRLRRGGVRERPLQVPPRGRLRRGQQSVRWVRRLCRP